MSELVGIDLGTTNSAIAVLDKTGRPEIVPNAQGERITPSAVFFEPGCTDKSLVGQSAMDNATVYPGRVFQAFKRSMANNTQLPLDDIFVTPIELSSLVLRKLIQDASRQVGPIKGAIVTVPANFPNEARLATMKAGEMAGITVSNIINEPTAALFYYSYHQEVGGTVLVYDFGGGTLDVTIARVNGRDVQIVASKGDPRLGGIDFDRKLEDLIHRAFEASTGEKFDPHVHQLGKTAEEYKKQLSTRGEISVQVVGGASGRKILTVTRQEFESATSTLVSRADLLVDSTLQEVGLTARDIANVFLVGGSTRMPMITAHLRRAFGREPVCHVNPDEVVALGAALYAGVSADRSQLNPAQSSVVGGMKLQEVANHYFGTISLSADPNTHVKRDINSIIIEKNTKLPCSKTESYYTVHEGQVAVDCRVTQSATRETDPDFVRIIWSGDLGPLPAGRPAGMEILVTYSYDKNQIMHCRFEDVASGIKREVEIAPRADKASEGMNTFLVE